MVSTVTLLYYYKLIQANQFVLPSSFRWSWEIVGLTTSLLGTTALASQSVLLVSSSIVYQLPYALSVAAAVRVGNLLGAVQPGLAKISADMALLLSLMTGSLNSALFLIFRRQWGGWFTQDEEVQQLIYGVMPILATFQLADSLTGAAGGILRGIGKQKASALINVTAYYAIGEYSSPSSTPCT